MTKKESISQLASGTGVTLFCAPQDVNLNLNAFSSFDKNQDEMMKVMPVPAKKKNNNPAQAL